MKKSHLTSQFVAWKLSAGQPRVWKSLLTKEVVQHNLNSWWQQPSDDRPEDWMHELLVSRCQQVSDRVTGSREGLVVSRLTVHPPNSHPPRLVTLRSRAFWAELYITLTSYTSIENYPHTYPGCRDSYFTNEIIRCVWVCACMSVCARVEHGQH